MNPGLLFRTLIRLFLNLTEAELKITFLHAHQNQPGQGKRGHKFLALATALMAVLSLSVTPAFATNTDGALDTSFGTNGYSLFSGVGYSAIYSVVVDGNGREVAGGESNNTAVLIRYLPNGSIDTTFGTNGSTSAWPGAGSINSIALDSAGRILAGGYAGVLNQSVFVVARYLSTGALDTSFGINGFATAAPSASNMISSIAIDGLDRIVVGGNSSGPTQSQPSLARFLPTGLLDTSFGTNGFVMSSSSIATIHSVAIDGSGRIFATGLGIVSGSSQSVLARYLPTGAVDTSFGSGGYATVGSSVSILSLTLDGQGRIITCGFSGISAYLARYLPTGLIDSSFGVSGVVTTSNGMFDLIQSVLVDSSGRILVGGYQAFNSSINQQSWRIILGRYLTSGALDTSFGSNGFNQTSPGASGGGIRFNDDIYAMALDSSGRIVTGGDAGGINNGAQLARYSNSPQVALVATPPPPPLQLSSLAGLTPLSGVNGTPTLVHVSGKFVESITNIFIDGVPLALNSWNQSSTSISFSVPSLKVGKHQVEIYNGSAPLLAVQEFTYVAAPAQVVAPTPALHKTKLVSLYFATGSAELTPRDIERLSALTKQTNSQTITSIKIVGYVGASVGEKASPALAEVRANATSAFLRQHGIAVEINASGSGMVDTASSNQSLNRRVDLYITYKL